MAGVHNMMVGGGVSFGFTPAAFSSNTADYKLRTALIAAGWDTLQPVTVILTIDSGTYLYASATNKYALDFESTYPAGSYIQINNNGTICGAGGAGGNGGAYSLFVGFGYESGQTQTAGSDGGPAIKVYGANNIVVVNNGVVAGGGGGGGGGPYTADNHYFEHFWASAGGGGGGGAGFVGGAAGATWSAGHITAANAASAGSISGGGAGGTPNNNAENSCRGGAGGAGGALGASGSTSGGVQAGGTLGSGSPIAGGLAGYYADGDSFITWSGSGSKLGRVTG